MVKKMKMSTENLDRHIRAAYRYAHANCTYGPTDRCFPPMEDEAADCVGLALRALYTMGYVDGPKNINEILDVCKSAGLVKSLNPADAVRHHGIVCMQENHVVGTANVSHVFYSLGGTGENDISKYDLGSNDRIRAGQPFEHVALNEWKDHSFLCVFYPSPERAKRAAVPDYEADTASAGTILKDAGLYEGPGTSWKKLRVLKAGADVVYGLRVTNDKGQDWRYVRYGRLSGYVYYSAVVPKEKFRAYEAKIGYASDGFAALRVGAGVDCYKIAELKSGTAVVVDGSATAGDGSAWLHVRTKAKRGFVAADRIERA